MIILRVVVGSLLSVGLCTHFASFVVRHACHNNVNVFFSIYLLSALALCRPSLSSSLLLLQRFASTKQQAAAYFALIICSTMWETVREQAAYCSFYRFAPDCSCMRASMLVLVWVCVCVSFQLEVFGAWRFKCARCAKRQERKKYQEVRCVSNTHHSAQSFKESTNKYPNNNN